MGYIVPVLNHPNINKMLDYQKLEGGGKWEYHLRAGALASDASQFLKK